MTTKSPPVGQLSGHAGGLRAADNLVGEVKVSQGRSQKASEARSQPTPHSGSRLFDQSGVADHSRASHGFVADGLGIRDEPGGSPIVLPERVSAELQALDALYRQLRDHPDKSATLWPGEGEAARSDSDLALMACAHGGDPSQASSALLSDPTFAEQLMGIRPEFYPKLPVESRANPKVAVRALVGCPANRDHLPESLRVDRVFAWLLLPRGGIFLDCFDEAIQTDPQLRLVAVANDASVLSLLVQPSALSEQILAAAREALSQGRLSGPLRDLPRELQADREAFLLGLARNPNAMTEIPEALQNDPEVVRCVLEAVLDGRAGRIYRSLPPALRNDPRVIAAVARQPNGLELLLPEHLCATVVAIAVRSHHDVYHSQAVVPYRADPEVVVAYLEAAASSRANPSAPLKNVPEQFRDDAAFVRLAIQLNPDNLEFASERLRDDADLVALACSLDGQCLRFASERLRGNKEIVLTAVSQCHQAIASATPELQKDLDVLAVYARHEGFKETPEGWQRLDGLGLAALRLQSGAYTAADLALVDPRWHENPAQVLRFVPGAARGGLLACVAERLLQDKKLLPELLRRDPRLLNELPLEVAGDPDLLRALLGADYVPEASAVYGTIEDVEIALALVSREPRCFACLSPEMRGNRLIARTALAGSAQQIEALTPVLRADQDFLVECGRLNPLVLWELSPAHRRVLERDPQLAIIGHQVRRAQAQLGIDHLERFQGDWQLFQEILANRISSPSEDSRPLALVITAKEDDNGGLKTLGRKVLRPLMQGHRVVYEECSSDEELVRAVRRHTEAKAAAVLVLAGHANRLKVRLGARDQNDSAVGGPHTLDLGDESSLQQANIGARVVKGGLVIMVGCLTGEGESQTNNVVNMLHRIFPQAHHIGPRRRLTAIPLVQVRRDGSVSSVRFPTADVYKIDPGS